MNTIATKTDKELLELAGAAAGLWHAKYHEACPEKGFPLPYATPGKEKGKDKHWNPYGDDADAGSAASSRQLAIGDLQWSSAAKYRPDRDNTNFPVSFVFIGRDNLTDDDIAELRRAIVQALASLVLP